jgi:hypothetical protein
MRRGTTWMKAPPLVNTAPGSPYSVVVWISQSGTAPSRSMHSRVVARVRNPSGEVTSAAA